jgi:hypothetical protein
MGATILFYLCFRNRDPRIRDANIYGRCTRTRATRPRGAGGGDMEKFHAKSDGRYQRAAVNSIRVEQCRLILF